jgi:hypothetical protein
MALIKTLNPAGVLVEVNGKTLDNPQVVEDIVDQVGSLETAIDSLEGGVGALPLLVVEADSDSAAITAAVELAVSEGRGVYFPPGTYTLTTTITFPQFDFLHVTGYGATFIYASNVRKAFQFTTGSRKLKVEGLTFQGADDDVAATNFYAALAFPSGTEDVEVTRCEFNQCTPVIWDTSETSTRFLLNNCVILNAPNGLSAPGNSIVDSCHFWNEELIDDRSHGLYFFGQAERILVTKCFFYRIANEDIQIRSGSSVLQTKGTFQVSDCHFEESGTYAIYIGTDTGTNVRQVKVTNNTFRNVSSAIHLPGVRNAVVMGNICEYDWQMPGTPGARDTTNAAISVTSGINNEGQLVAAGNVIISDNTIANRHPFFAVMTIDDDPADGDTVVLAGVTYTFKTTPAAPVNDTAQNLWNEMIGRGDLAMNSALRTVDDVLYSPNNASGKMVISSGSTFTLTKSSANITINTTPADNRDAVPFGILVEKCLTGVSIHNNRMTDLCTSVSVTYTERPSVRGNEVSSPQQNGSLHSVGIECVGNVFSHLAANRVAQGKGNTPLGPQNIIVVADAFPIIEDDNMGPTQSQEYEFPAYRGRSGVVTLTADRKAQALLWYGLEVAGGDLGPQTIPFRWSDGDVIELRGAASYDLTFKRTAPGANEFNSLASLVTLIDGKAEYEATSPSPALGANQGYILLKVAAAGVGGNSSRVNITNSDSPTRSRLNAVGLPDPDLGPACYFYGGVDAAQTRTFIWSPAANSVKGVDVGGADAAGVALAPYVLAADVINGVGAYVTHLAAAGGEKLWYRFR